jgi:hypothetical protein
VSVKHRFFIVPLCNISQIATGMLYSESPRKKPQPAPILINIGRNLTCFGPDQSFDLLGCGPLLTVIGVLSTNLKEPKCSLIYSVDRSSTSSTSRTSITSSTVEASGQNIRKHIHVLDDFYNFE